MTADTAPAWHDPKLIDEFNAVMDRAGQAFLEKSPHGSLAEWRHMLSIAAIRFIVSDQSAREAAAVAAGAREMRGRAADYVAECLAELGLPFGVESIRALPLPDTTALDRLLAEAREDIAATAQFLIDRLNEWSPDNLTDENCSDWMGHVEPAIYRLQAILSEPGA